jgi:hypothetical protein
MDHEKASDARDGIKKVSRGTRSRFVGPLIVAKTETKIIAAGLLIVLVTFSVFLSFYPREEGRNRVNRVLGCKSQDVYQVVLKPVEQRNSLIDMPIVISDRESIDAICKAFNSASHFGPNHPAIEWEVIVEIWQQESHESVVVWHTTQADNGTCISIQSNVTSGWNFGSYRSDSLGPMLERFARKEQK